MRTHRVIFGVLVGCWLFVSAARAEGRAGAPDGIDVLLLDARPALDETVRERLRERGMRVVLRKSTLPLSDEMLRQFHAVLLPAFHGLSVESFFIVPHEIPTRTSC